MISQERYFGINSVAVAIKAIVTLCMLLGCCFFLRAQDCGAGTREFRFHYALDRSVYVDGFMGNAETADSLEAFLLNLGDERILDAEVIAYASPEGTNKRNRILCADRASSFMALVETRFPQLSGKLTSCAGGEAWDGLRSRLEQDTRLQEENPQAYRTIFQILDDENLTSEQRERRLKASLEPNWYNYLRWIHYRWLRCCVVRLRYVQNVDIVEPVEAADIVDEADTVSVVDTMAVVDTVVAVDTVFAAQKETEETVLKALRPVLGVSTNLPYDITYVPKYGVTSIPSFSVEYYPQKGHYTIGADVEWPMWQHWDTHRFMQVNNLTVWTRRYFKPVDGRFRGAYLLASANAARYGIGWEAQGWEGEGLGASLGGGYKIKLGRRMFLDLGGALGIFYSGYDPYVWGNDATGRYYYDYAGDPEQFKLRNKRLFWFGPTRVYISIGVDLFNRKK